MSKKVIDINSKMDCIKIIKWHDTHEQTLENIIIPDKVKASPDEYELAFVEKAKQKTITALEQTIKELEQKVIELEGEHLPESFISERNNYKQKVEALNLTLGNEIKHTQALEQKVERLTEKYRKLLRCASDNCGADCGDMQGNDCAKALSDTEGE